MLHDAKIAIRASQLPKSDQNSVIEHISILERRNNILDNSLSHDSPFYVYTAKCEGHIVGGKKNRRAYADATVVGWTNDPNFVLNQNLRIRFDQFSARDLYIVSIHHDMAEVIREYHKVSRDLEESGINVIPFDMLDIPVDSRNMYPTHHPVGRLRDRHEITIDEWIDSYTNAIVRAMAKHGRGVSIGCIHEMSRFMRRHIKGEHNAKGRDFIADNIHKSWSKFYKKVESKCVMKYRRIRSNNRKCLYPVTHESELPIYYLDRRWVENLAYTLESIDPIERKSIGGTYL